MLNLLDYAGQLHGNTYFNHSSSVIALFKSITVQWFKVTIYYRSCVSQRDWYKNSRNSIPECYSSPSKYPEMIFLSSRKLTKKIPRHKNLNKRMFILICVLCHLVMTGDSYCVG